jgi:hypothetical protein
MGWCKPPTTRLQRNAIKAKGAINIGRVLILNVTRSLGVGAQRAGDHLRNKGNHSLPSTNYSCTIPNRSSNPAIMRPVPNAIRYHSDTRRSFPE